MQSSIRLGIKLARAPSFLLLLFSSTCQAYFVDLHVSKINNVTSGQILRVTTPQLFFIISIRDEEISFFLVPSRHQPTR
jgi:hypothetical protein